MAVGYLDGDWDPRYVATRSRGREFIGAVHVFTGEKGKKVISFYEGYALRFLDDDGADASASTAFALLKDEGYKQNEELWDEDEYFGEDQLSPVVLIDKYGTVSEAAITIMGLEVEAVQKYWDECARYWGDPDED